MEFVYRASQIESGRPPARGIGELPEPHRLPDAGEGLRYRSSSPYRPPRAGVTQVRKLYRKGEEGIIGRLTRAENPCHLLPRSGPFKPGQPVGAPAPDAGFVVGAAGLEPA